MAEPIVTDAFAIEPATRDFAAAEVGTHEAAAFGAADLRGKVAFVTGAASGLGAALAATLAQAGADIVAADLRTEPLQASLAILRGYGVRAEALTLDVGDPPTAHAAIERTVDRLGRLDILVNNAGTDVTLPIDALSEQEWLRVINTNLNGPFLLAKHAAAHMRASATPGDIVNVASTAAKRAWPNASAYHASKWGLLGLSHALHAELRPYDIRVTAVVAGGMRTPFLLDRFPDLDPARLQDPATVALAIRQVLLLPRESVIPELTILPMQETSWP
ncbi:SDR family oxidoreductase [Massilia phyllosphaerae]|uniref:SDR family oxidoreductase n=1 Tax=Massilia phyllosphaerae TaxID=3106034 RepID=UPI002B1CAE62|nr:SDR family oxidoreductase [Massilia sp. SGZ-792]